MNDTSSMSGNIAARWALAKPMVMGLAIGVVAGPIISGLAGFQIRTSTAAAAERASLVSLQAEVCSERAKAASPGFDTTNWQVRNDLARQWAAMPGSTAVDQDVVYACSTRLGR
ncbi:hypothetical protein [Roseomonas sp. AR75]|uniref:hypothetical protein n=1 Tax=Roseomonas sp. AR75 TaxID=2562311 RepID=UPI0010BFCD1C|nr:hypothetical protein [Roseomonas sp. AR75]